MGILIILLIITIIIIISCFTTANKKYDKGEKGSTIYWAALGGFWVHFALNIFKAFFTE